MSFDIPTILKQVESGAPAGSAPPAWLTQSWDDPDGFSTALCAYEGSRSPPPQSNPALGYDFYFDLVLRRLTNDRVALRWYDSQLGLRTLTLAQLHERCSLRCRQWLSQKVKPKAVLALVRPVDGEFLIALCTALRLGLCLSIIPPLGLRFVARRLAALKPDHISTDRVHLSLCKGFENRVLLESGDSGDAPKGYVYKPAEPVAKLFSPLVDPPDVPVLLTAATAWQGALRDGLLVYRLRPDDILSAPCTDLLQYQPSLIFAALITSASYLHLEPENLQEDPSLLEKQPIRSLGISERLRPLMAPRGSLGKQVAHWFRNPEEPLDAKAWGDFLDQQGLKSVVTSAVLIDSAAGGAVLASQRRVLEGKPDQQSAAGRVNMEVLPAAGRAWSLLDPNKSGQAALAAAGVYTPLPVDKKRPAYVLLVKPGAAYQYGGTTTPRRSGQVYPGAEVTAAVSELPFVLGAHAVLVPSSSPSVRTVVLLFTGAEAADPTKATSSDLTSVHAGAARRCISQQLTPDLLPDAIEVYPLYPRLKDGVVDGKWCDAQYLSGALFRKTREPLFLTLTALRKAMSAHPARKLAEDAKQDAANKGGA